MLPETTTSVSFVTPSKVRVSPPLTVSVVTPSVMSNEVAIACDETAVTRPFASTVITGTAVAEPVVPAVTPELASVIAISAAAVPSKFTVPVASPETLIARAVSSADAVAALPEVSWLPAVFTPARSILIVPSNDTPPMLIAVASPVAVVALPEVSWLPAVFTPGRSMFAEPSNETPPTVRAVARAVAVSALPVTSPVTLPVKVASVPSVPFSNTLEVPLFAKTSPVNEVASAPDTVPLRVTSPEPSMLTEPERSPPSVIVRAVAHADAVSALPVRSPVTLPVTSAAIAPEPSRLTIALFVLAEVAASIRSV